jgi:hypothetical protein
MRKLVIVGFLALAAIAFFKDRGGFLHNPAESGVFESAYAEHRSNFVAEGSGTVTRILADDNNGSRHQRFIISLSSGQTLLIAHNIDLAPRVEPLAVGDRISFKGEYEWSEKGGTVHRTHHDPAGRHESGWIRSNGKTYE